MSNYYSDDGGKIVAAKYYVRLDDAHEEMHHENWARVESVLRKFDVRPIVGVIPDCKDSSICFGSFDINFWEKVRSWAASNWHIGMHGYQHALRPSRSGLFPVNKYSEFVDLTYDKQKSMIEQAVAIFAKNNVSPSLFIAPAHGADLNTLKALADSSDIRIISDGFYIYPRHYQNFTIFPQQLWKFRRMPFGVWTICLHPSSMSDDNFMELEGFLNSESKYFPHKFVPVRRTHKLLNSIFNFMYTQTYEVKHCLK